MATSTRDQDTDDLAILQKIEEANRLLEQDRKSVKSLVSISSLTVSGSSHKSSNSGHSRKGSDSSSISSRISNQWSLNEDVTGSVPEDSWVLWGQIIADWDNYAKKKSTSLKGFLPESLVSMVSSDTDTLESKYNLKEVVRKGVPHHLRPIVWQLLCGANNSESKEMYAEYLKKSSPCEKGIRRDIARTYPEHDFFKEKDGLGQESLFNVMKAYSLQDREVGYCQGSAFIVGLLLMQMPEEDAFAVLVQLMQEYRLRELFKPNMMELGLCMFQLECLVQDLLPELSMHFQSQGFHTSMYASSWFLTLYTTTLPQSLACRVMDVYISEGLEVIFKIGLAILQDNEEELMGLDMEGMIRYFQNEIPAKYETEPEHLLNVAFQVKMHQKKMKKLEKEYTALKTKQNEEQVELRRLRSENRLLRQRIDNLEKETGTLADRLIDSQVRQAQAAEEMFIVKRELSGVKQRNSSFNQQLEEAQDVIIKLQDKTNRNSVISDMDTTTKGSTFKHLQEELNSMRDKVTEQKCNMQDLHDKIKELETINRRLQDEPASEVAVIQEELTASKLREAEASLAVKDLRQHVKQLDLCWQQHLERISHKGSSKEKTSKSVVQHLQEELMTVKLREAETLAESKELKQKVMELETQYQISVHQIKRMNDDHSKVKEDLEESLEREKALKGMVKEAERRVSDMESKDKEVLMMNRIKDAEFSQAIAEMRQRIAQLEIENQELITTGQLHEHRGDTQELLNRIADLQDKVLRLKLNKKLPLSKKDSLATNESDSEWEHEILQHTMKDVRHYLPSDSDSGSLNSLHRLELTAISTSNGDISSIGSLQLPINGAINEDDAKVFDVITAKCSGVTAKSTDAIEDESSSLTLNGDVTTESDDVTTETIDIRRNSGNKTVSNRLPTPRKSDIISRFDSVTQANEIKASQGDQMTSEISDDTVFKDS